MNEEEERDMETRNDDVLKKSGTGSVARKELIRKIGNKICDRNDEGVRRLSKG